MKQQQQPAVRHDRRRWNVLIVALAAYLTSHSYAFGVLATCLFQVIVELFINIHRGRPWTEWAIGAAISILTIAVGVTINAFTAYVFDLTFLFGLQWLYLAVVVVFYIHILALDTATKGRVYLDYVFSVGSLGILALMMNFVAFGEPYTFLTAMLYIVSVICLSATSSVLRWWAGLIFVVFWIIVIIVGVIVNISLDRGFRYPLSRYFSQTPLLD